MGPGAKAWARRRFCPTSAGLCSPLKKFLKWTSRGFRVKPELFDQFLSVQETCRPAWRFQVFQWWGQLKNIVPQKNARGKIWLLLRGPWPRQRGKSSLPERRIECGEASP